MTDTLHDFVRSCDRQIEKQFRHQGRVHVMFHLVNAAGEQGVFAAPPMDDKDMAMAVMRKMFAMMDVRRYVMVMEAWIVEAKGVGVDAVNEYAESGKSLEFAPGRKEMVVYSAEDEKEGALMAMREIIRPERGKARLGPLDIMPGDGVAEGRMVGLLPPAGTRH